MPTKKKVAKKKIKIPKERLVVESGKCCICGKQIIGDKRVELVRGHFFEYHDDSVCWGGWKKANKEMYST